MVTSKAFQQFFATKIKIIIYQFKNCQFGRGLTLKGVYLVIFYLAASLTVGTHQINNVFAHILIHNVQGDQINMAVLLWYLVCKT